MDEQKFTEIKTVSISELKVGQYQVWSKMTNEKFEQFTEDIKLNGIRDLIHVDENMVILDGHHRYESSKIAGIDEVLVKVYYGLDEDGKQEIAHKNNTLTREISREEKIAKAIELRKQGRTYRQISEWLGIGEETARQWIIKFAHPHDWGTAKSEGEDGKYYPKERQQGCKRKRRQESFLGAYSSINSIS